ALVGSHRAHRPGCFDRQSDRVIDHLGVGECHPGHGLPGVLVHDGEVLVGGDRHVAEVVRMVLGEHGRHRILRRRLLPPAPGTLTLEQREELEEREARRGHLALLAVQLCFGLFPLLGKLAFEAFAPAAVAAWRLWAGAAVFALLAAIRYGRGALPAWRDLPLFWLTALLGVAANQALYLEGLKRTTAMNAGLLMMLIPVFTTAIAVMV